MVIAGFALFVFRYPLIGLFSSDPEVQRVGSQIMFFIALYQIFDAMFVVYVGALRGAGDTLVPAVVQAALPEALRELWGSWLGHKSGAVLCFSNPPTTSVRQFAGLLQPNPEHQGLAVTPGQDVALRGFFRFPGGGNIYLYPVMAQAKMGEALAAVSLAVFFARAGLPVQTTQSRFLTWDSIRKSNVILLGHADSNQWVEPVLKSTPFTLAPTDERRRARILNRQPKPGEPDRWEIFTHGGRNPTGLDAVDYAREVVALGAGEILLTSMDRDGTRQGFDIALTRAIADAVPVPVIASGGVGTLEHLVEGIRDGHATAVLAASIFHFGEYSVREAKDYMAKAGLPMRLDP
jgi:hypothetical protein